MSAAAGLVMQLEMSQKFFKTALSGFDEADAEFAPQAGLFTLAGHVAHTADTIDWFVEGAFGDGWNLDFDAHIAGAKAVTSLAAAVEWLDRAYAGVIEAVGSASDEVLFASIPDPTMMKGAPRASIVSAITDHTAHHRGALAVYARLLGKEPVMPYS